MAQAHLIDLLTPTGSQSLSLFCGPMGVSLQLFILLIFVDLQLVVARRCRVDHSRRCPLVRECPRSSLSECRDCVDGNPNTPESALPWCLRCPVCKANQIEVSPCSQSRGWKCKGQKLNLGLTVEQQRSQREVQQTVTSTPVSPNSVSAGDHSSSGSDTIPISTPVSTTNLVIHIRGHGAFANDRTYSGSDTVPTWTIAVAVVCPALAIVTVVLVWRLKKSIVAREQQANNRFEEDMIPLTAADQSDNEIDSLLNLQTANGNNSHGQVRAPVFTKGLQCGHAQIGKLVFLSCEVDGSPEPAIQWRKDGVELADGGAFLITRTTLTVLKMTAALGGQYVCIATNKHGQAITRATLAVIGNFDEVDGDEDTPSVKVMINSNLPIENPQDTSIATAGSSVYYNDDIQWTFEMRFPGGDVKLCPSASEDEDVREYRERMALHTSHYEDSYLKEYQEERRLANSMRLEEYGFTATTINWLSGKEEDEKVLSTNLEGKET